MTTVEGKEGKEDVMVQQEPIRTTACKEAPPKKGRKRKQQHHEPAFINPDRVECPGCGRRHLDYCPRCVIPLHSDASSSTPPPQVTLPLHVDMYRHPKEKEGKSTAPHIKLLSTPDTAVDLFTDHDFSTPEDMAWVRERYPHPERVLLLYPSEQAIPIDHESLLSAASSAQSTFGGSVSSGEGIPFHTLIVIDGTWRQAKSMCRELSALPFVHVKLQTYKTRFWRFQEFGESHLATIEAIHAFFVEFDRAMGGGNNDASLATCKYDGLLHYFLKQYSTIQGYYQERPHRSFTKRKLDAVSYIKPVEDK